MGMVRHRSLELARSSSDLSLHRKPWLAGDAVENFGKAFQEDGAVGKTFTPEGSAGAGTS